MEDLPSSLCGVGVRTGVPAWVPCFSLGEALSVALLPLVGEEGEETPLSAIQSYHHIPRCLFEIRDATVGEGGACVGIKRPRRSFSGRRWHCSVPKFLR